MQNKTRSPGLFMNFECQVSLSTSCTEHQTYIMKCMMSAAMSGCGKRMQNILMPYLNWQSLLYWEFLLSQWEPGDTAVKPRSKNCPVKGALSTCFASSTVNVSPCCSYLESPCAYFSFRCTSLIFQSFESPSTLMPFHQIQEKLNSNAITPMLCFQVKISVIRLSNSYLLKNRQAKMSSLFLLNINETTDQSSLQIAAHLYLVCSSAYQKLTDFMKIRLKCIIQRKLYIQYSKQSYSDPEKNNAACGTSLDFAKSTCQFNLAQVHQTEREANTEINISMRLAFRHMILHPFIKSSYLSTAEIGS